MDKQQIIEALVYDTIVAAKRAAKACEEAQSVLDEKTAQAQQANLAAELMAGAFGIDVGKLRAKADEEAAI